MLPNIIMSILYYNSSNTFQNPRKAITTLAERFPPSGKPLQHLRNVSHRPESHYNTCGAFPTIRKAVTTLAERFPPSGKPLQHLRKLSHRPESHYNTCGAFPTIRKAVTTLAEAFPDLQFFLTNPCFGVLISTASLCSGESKE